MATNNALNITGAGIPLYDGTGVFTALPYLTNTWVPALTFGGGSTGITYSVQTGGYYEIGKVVFFNFLCSLSSKGSSTGVAAVTGFPFTSGTGTDSTYVLLITNLTYPTLCTSLVGTISNAATAMKLFGTGTTTLTQLADTNFANNSTFQSTGIYWQA